MNSTTLPPAPAADAAPRVRARSSVQLVWVRSEVRRRLRNRRVLLFTVAMPVLFYIVFTSSTGDGGDGTIGGLPASAYLMVSMATFGALGAVFNGGGYIAVERGSGWTRQLRLTGLTGRQYLVGKMAAAYVAALPGVLIVFILGGALHDVHLSAGRWIAVGVSILAGLLPIGALGLLVGYTVRAEAMQAITGGVYSILSLLGGIWFPADNFPHWLREIARALPMYWSAGAGRAALRGSWVGWHGVTVLAVWTVALGVLAARAYQRDATRA